jgi:tetratricopeptide (TPR) repeat protein
MTAHSGDGGDALLSQGDATGALASYRAGLALREALVAGDPSNAGWQRDLMVSRYNVGEGLRARGDAPGALAAYRAALAISERLVASDPDNASLQGELAELRDMVAHCCREAGGR